MSVATTNKAAVDNLLQLVSFSLGQEEFGLDITKVREINRMLDVTAVPNSPDYMEGVINLRGRVIPIVNLRRCFGMERKENDKNTRVVVVELSNKTVGFVVDAVRQVIRISSTVVVPAPSLVGGTKKEYITGVGRLDDRLLILLDLECLLDQNQLHELEEVAA